VEPATIGWKPIHLDALSSTVIELDTLGPFRLERVVIDSCSASVVDLFSLRVDGQEKLGPEYDEDTMRDRRVIGELLLLFAPPIFAPCTAFKTVRLEFYNRTTVPVRVFGNLVGKRMREGR